MRQRYGLSPGDKMENLGVNAAVWRIFVSVTLQAAVHRGKDYSENLRSIKNQSMRSLKQLFHVNGKLNQEEITSIPVIDWQQQMWQRTTLLTDKQFILRLQNLSFLIQCCGWAASVKIPSEHGKRRVILVYGITSI